MKQQFLKGTTDRFETHIYEDNRAIVPSSATIAVHAPDGVALVSGSAMTIGADGLLGYELGPAENAKAGENYKAQISYVYGGKALQAVLYYDVVTSRLLKVITDDDIISELPQLQDNGWRVRGEAKGGSSTGIIDPELKRYPDDFFTGGLAYSPAKNETREVTGFASSTGTVATTLFSSTIQAGEKYILYRAFSKEIRRAFEKIEDRLVRLGRRPHLVLDSYDLREAHIFFSVAEACKSLITAKDTFWWDLWKEYEKRADEAFKGLVFKYDASGEPGAHTAVTIDGSVPARVRRR